MKHYGELFEGKGTTGAQLLAVMSDAPLIAFGIESELDRKYLLLQVRGAT